MCDWLYVWILVLQRGLRGNVDFCMTVSVSPLSRCVSFCVTVCHPSPIHRIPGSSLSIFSPPSPLPPGVTGLGKWIWKSAVGRCSALFPEYKGWVGSTRGWAWAATGERKGDRGGPLLSSPLPAPSAPSPAPPGKSLFAWYLHFICIAFN